MFTLVITVILIIAVLLILVVLMQDSKGGIGSMSGSSASQLVGVKKASDVLEKSTWLFMVLIIVLSIAANVALKPSKETTQNATFGGNIEANAPIQQASPQQTTPQEQADQEKPQDIQESDIMELPADKK